VDAVTAKPDPETAALLEHSLHYPMITLRQELRILMDVWQQDAEKRHATQKRNKRYIDQVRRAMSILAKHDGVPS
jgi:hypothetical protein